MTTREFREELKLTKKQLEKILAKSAETGYFDYGGKRWKPVKVRGKHGQEWRIDEIERPALSSGRPDLQDMDLSELKRQKAIAEVERIRQFSDKEREKLRAAVIAEMVDAMRALLVPLADALAEVVRAPDEVARLRGIIERIILEGERMA